VNNAGGWLPGPQFPDADAWGGVLDLNLRMPMLATKLALPLPGGGGGAVFTTAMADFADRFQVHATQPQYAVDPAASTQPTSDLITAVPDPREPTT